MTRERPPGRPAAAFLLALATSAALPLPAAAAPLPVALASRAGHVQATMDLGPLLPADLEQRLGNGLRNVIEVVVAVVPRDGEEPTVAFGRIVEVLFDVWEETWAVTVRDPRNPAGRRQVFRTVPELIQLLAHAADADLGPSEGLPPGPFTVDVRLDFNPVSAEQLERTREYLAGSAGPVSASHSVLGTVAGFLLREPEEAAESLHFRSALMTPASVHP